MRSAGSRNAMNSARIREARVVWRYQTTTRGVTSAMSAHATAASTMAAPATGHSRPAANAAITIVGPTHNAAAAMFEPETWRGTRHGVRAVTQASAPAHITAA